MAVEKYTFHVSGMQCATCQALIEQQLNCVEGVSEVSVNFKKKMVQLSLDRRYSIFKWLTILNNHLNPYHFQLSSEPEVKKNDDFWLALPIGLSLLLLFIFLQRSGWLHLDMSLARTTPFSSWIIGLVASLSGCLVVVGGLVLSLSGEQASFSANKKFILSFHFGRLVGFFVLGGILGGLGQLVGISFTFSALVGMLASCMMLIVGFRLVGFSFFPLPKFFSLYRYIKQPRFPFLLGVVTFFLPCGFAQSMQLAALASGSWHVGAIIMLFFSLGTLPILLFISFGGAVMVQSKHSAVLVKVLGIVVIGFGVLTFLIGLVSLRVLPPILEF